MMTIPEICDKVMVKINIADNKDVRMIYFAQMKGMK